VIIPKVSYNENAIFNGSLLRHGCIVEDMMPETVRKLNVLNGGKVGSGIGCLLRRFLQYML
jgi:hypothetical protein